MSKLFDFSSLAMIPTAYKDGKLYSVRPTDGDGDFTFSRGSNLAATRVDVNGLIEKGRENIFLRSNEFNLTWNTYNATITSGATDPNGGSTAWTLAKTGTYGDIGQVQSGITGVLTFSVYAKAGTLDHLQLSNSASPFMGVMFDLTNGSVASEANNISSNITSIGGGWYRLEAVVNQSAGGEWRLQPADGVGGVPNANLGNVIIYKAQLEYGLVATDYIETGTSAAQSGILEDMPRLDYSGSCPSLLLEPQRSNLIPFSEHLNSSAFGKTRCTIEDNSTTSPEGVVNASKMTSTDSAESYIQDNVTTTGTKFTWSFFAKKGDLDYAHGLVWDLSANGCRQWFNLSTGAVGGTTTFGSGYSIDSATIEDYGNGWYRCAMVVNSTAGTQGCRVNISSADTTITSAVNSYGYFYGLQAEAASYPTSYIPTYGTSQTRSEEDYVDAINFESGDILDSSSPYTLFFDLSAEPTLSPADGNSQFLRLYSGQNLSTAMWSLRKYYQDADGKIRFYSNLDAATGAYVTSTNKKFAMVVDGTDVRFFSDGAKQYTYGATNNHNGAGSMRLSSGSSQRTSTNFSQVLLFPTALTDAEAIALTS